MSITMNSSGSSSNNSQESESNLNGLESYVEQTTQTHRVLNWVHTCPYCSKSFTSSQALGGHQNAHRRERFLLRRRSRRAWPCPRSHFPRSVRQVRQPPPPPRPVFLPWFGYGAPIKNVFRHNGCVYGVAGLPLQAINGVHALPRQLAPSFTYYHPPYPAVMEAPPTQRLLQEENLLGEGPCSESTETDPAIRDLIRNDNDVEVNKLDLTLRL